MKKKIVVGLFMLLLVTGTARAFQTWDTWFLPGTLNSAPIHDQIALVLKEECGFSDTGYERVIDWMSDSDVPFSDKVADPLLHFDDQKILAARDGLFGRLDEMVKKSPTVLKDNDSLEIIYRLMGEIFHASHDFYAHTTHVEYVLYHMDRGELVAPNTTLETLPLVEWMTVGELGRYERGELKNTPLARLRDLHSEIVLTTIDYIKSGYYLTEEVYMDSLDNVYGGVKAGFPDANLRPKHDYCTIMDCGTISSDDPEEYLSYQNAIENAVGGYDEMHVYLNKDGPDTTMGRVEHPKLKKNLHEIAFSLARRETVRLWKFMESEIRRQHPQKADCIIKTIKTGIVSESCATDEIGTLETPLTLEKPPTLETGLPAGSEGQMTLYFEASEEGGADIKADNVYSAKIEGHRKMRGTANLKVDWTTGEIVGVGKIQRTAPSDWKIEGYESEVKTYEGKVQSDAKTKSITVYVSGWLEDGGKQIRAVRVYSVEKEVMQGTERYKNQIRNVSGEPTRLCDETFVKLLLDGTPTVNDLSPMESGPVKMHMYRKAWAKMKSAIPLGLPAKYKQTKFGDGGALAKKVGLPPVESYEGMMQEMRKELPETKRLLAEVFRESDRDAAEPMDPEEAQMMEMQRKMLAQASSALETADQKMDEAEDKE